MMAMTDTKAKPLNLSMIISLLLLLMCTSSNASSPLKRPMCNRDPRLLIDPGDLRLQRSGGAACNIVQGMANLLSCDVVSNNVQTRVEEWANTMSLELLSCQREASVHATFMRTETQNLQQALTQANLQVTRSQNSLRTVLVDLERAKQENTKHVQETQRLRTEIEKFTQELSSSKSVISEMVAQRERQDTVLRETLHENNGLKTRLEKTTREKRILEQRVDALSYSSEEIIKKMQQQEDQIFRLNQKQRQSENMWDPKHVIYCCFFVALLSIIFSAICFFYFHRKFEPTSDRSGEIQKIKAELNSKIAAAEQNSKQLSDERNRISSLQAEKKELENKVSEQNQIILSLKDSQKEASDENSQKIEILENEIEEQKRNSVVSFEEFTKEISEKLKALETSEEKSNKMKMELERKNLELQSEKDRIEKFQKELQHKDTALQNTKQIIDKMTSEVEKNYRNFLAEKNHLQSELYGLNESCDCFRREISSLKKHVVELEEKNSKMLSEKKTVEKQDFEEKSSVQQLREEIALHRVEAQKTRKTIAELRTKISEENSANETMNTKVVVLQHNISEKDREISAVTEEKEKAERELQMARSDAQAEIQGIQSEIESLKATLATKNSEEEVARQKTDALEKQLEYGLNQFEKMKAAYTKTWEELEFQKAKAILDQKREEELKRNIAEEENAKQQLLEGLERLKQERDSEVRGLQQQVQEASQLIAKLQTKRKKKPLSPSPVPPSPSPIPASNPFPSSSSTSAPSPSPSLSPSFSNPSPSSSSTSFTSPSPSPLPLSSPFPSPSSSSTSPSPSPWPLSSPFPSPSSSSTSFTSPSPSPSHFPSPSPSPFPAPTLFPSPSPSPFPAPSFSNPSPRKKSMEEEIQLFLQTPDIQHFRQELQAEGQNPQEIHQILYQVARDAVAQKFKKAELAESTKRLDERISALGFFKIPVERDGNCFYYSAAFGIFGDISQHRFLRQKIAEKMRGDSELREGYCGEISWDEYCSTAGKNGIWAQEYELVTCAKLFNVKFFIITSTPDEEFVREICPKGVYPTKTIYLSYLDDLHYDIIVKM